MAMMWASRNSIFIAILVLLVHQQQDARRQSHAEIIVEINGITNALIDELRSKSYYSMRRPSPPESIGSPPVGASHHVDPPFSSDPAPSSGIHGRMSIANMTCKFFSQPLNHFVPRGKSPHYQQRYCYYNGYAEIDKGNGESKKGHSSNESNGTVLPAASPIFFYTGNESPLEQYINQTGLMWELAPKFRATVVFVEHRYEGQSVPTNLSEACLSYASTVQALADYARILQVLLNPSNQAPVIAFGGSYGGMLTAWMRMKYPHLIAGGIAASAPIGAFPQSANTKIDWAAQVLTAALDKPYPPTDEVRRGGVAPEAAGPAAAKGEGIVDRGDDGTERDNHCVNNLLAAWPLITWLARNESNAVLLLEVFSLCQPLADNNPEPLLRWAQSIWFDLAEGSFPYPSSYIPFALLHKKVDLPAWPMQAACWKQSLLYKDWGIRYHNYEESVHYRIDYGDSGLTLDVDWDTVNLARSSNLTQADAQPSSFRASKDIVGLLTSVRDAVSIWYNISKDVACYDVSDVAPNYGTTRLQSQRPNVGSRISPHYFDTSERSESRLDPQQLCAERMTQGGSWEPVCCNDEMNLVITEARGIGHDFFWPPSHPRSVRTYEDVVRNVTAAPCLDPQGFFGYSKEPYDLWSTWLDTYYGGIRMSGHSNIVFSNGLLDPWSAGGVYKDVNRLPQFRRLNEDRAELEKITDYDVVSLIIPFGGHHTDLMYSSEDDPDCVTEARRIEYRFIEQWINDWRGGP